MIRTRAIIEGLCYDDLVKQGIIPDLISLINQSPSVIASKRYPPFVYQSKDFSTFGIILDYIVRAGLRVNLQQKVELGVDPVSGIIPTLADEAMTDAVTHLNRYETSNNMNDIARSSLELSRLLREGTTYTSAMMDSYVPSLVNIMKELVAKWNYFGAYLSGTVKFNAEYTYGNFAGHPDIVSDKVVLDIKNTASFSKMAKEASLQVLAYYALIKPQNPNIQYVGFVLPMQREVAIYDLGNWNPTAYLQLLSVEANKMNASNTQMNAMVNQLMQLIVSEGEDKAFELLAGALTNIQDFTNVGSHISKGKNIATSLQDFATAYPGVPCQIFLTNPRTGKRNAKTAGQIKAAAHVIKQNNLQCFIHAPYVINLCANERDVTGDYWQQRILNEELSFASQMGCKGVVVHTGARKKLPEDQALNIMEYMVRTALSYATEDCPLLLETPAAEGTEVVTRIEELGNFFFRFNEEERKKLGICIDTCHTHSASYDPLGYLQHWEQYCQTPIKLVHFNDSQGECGCHKDRHAAPGQGHIGMEKMRAIADWCTKRSIPMIRE